MEFALLLICTAHTSGNNPDTILQTKAIPSSPTLAGLIKPQGCL
jgi:hypothetical protein